jgi:hypothetical protein
MMLAVGTSGGWGSAVGCACQTVHPPFRDVRLLLLAPLGLVGVSYESFAGRARPAVWLGRWAEKGLRVILSAR